MISQVTRKLLSGMQCGESRVFTEKTHNAGAMATGYALRANIKITTEACLVVIPATAKAIKAVIVTRVE